jgi:hypothetical protein
MAATRKEDCMKSRWIIRVFLAFTFLLLTGCSGKSQAQQTENAAFRVTLTFWAQSIHTPPALPKPEDIFKTAMSHTPHYTPPPTPLSPTLTPALPENVKSICLNLDQKFALAEAKLPDTRAFAVRMLENSHYRVLQPGGACDASLDIQLTLTPLSEKYTNLGGSGSSTCYTGAKATGTATMTVGGQAPQIINLVFSRPPTTGIVVIISTCPGPTQAPFTYPAFGAARQALLELVGPQILFAAARDEDESIRASAVWEFWNLYQQKKYPIPKSVMMQSLDDPSKDVRYATVVVLGQYATEAEFAFQKLVAMLQTDPEASVREVVVNSLGRIKHNDPILLEPMRGALKDPDKGVYTMALSELCYLGRATKSVVPEIFTFYEAHPDETYRVWNCMRDISGENLGSDPAEWHAWWEKNK